MIQPKDKFDLPLEGLRGLACLLVLHMHLSPGGVDPTSPVPLFFFDQFSMGKEAVLIFFLLSGYVIGLTNRKPYTRPLAKIYLRKRLIRLVPLCWIAIILSVLAYPGDAASAVAGNFFFLQNWHRYLLIYVPVLIANPNLWSLNYEMLYYLSFLCVWFWKPSSRQMGGLILTMLVIAIMGWFLITQARSLTGYAVGAVFWYSGLWLAWYGKPLETAAVRIPWLSIWLLFIAIQHIDAGLQLVTQYHWIWALRGHLPFLTMLDFQTFPICLIIMAAATGRQVPLKAFLWTVSWEQPLLFVIVCLATSNFALMTTYAVPVPLLALALLLWPLRSSNLWLARLAPVGFISYGLYIFGRPAESIVDRHLLAGFSGSYLSYFTRLGLILVIAFALAYVGEKIFQPWIRDFLNRRFPSAKTDPIPTPGP